MFISPFPSALADPVLFVGLRRAASAGCNAPRTVNRARVKLGVYMSHPCGVLIPYSRNLAVCGLPVVERSNFLRLLNVYFLGLISFFDIRRGILLFYNVKADEHEAEHSKNRRMSVKFPECRNSVHKQGFRRFIGGRV